MNAPTDGAATEKARPVPVIDSVSLTTTDEFAGAPLAGVAVADAVALVAPGTGMPVTLSVYVAVATSLNVVAEPL